MYMSLDSLFLLQFLKNGLIFNNFRHSERQDTTKKWSSYFVNFCDSSKYNDIYGQQIFSAIVVTNT
jgi:hypothetical protein